MAKILSDILAYLGRGLVFIVKDPSLNPTEVNISYIFHWKIDWKD